MYTALNLLTGLILAVWFTQAKTASAQVLTRSEVVRIALADNPRVSAARAAWDAAKAQRLVSLALEDPREISESRKESSRL